MKYLNRFFFALSFLTRIPIPFEIEDNQKVSSKSMFYYPLVGVIIGIITAGIDRLFFQLFPVNVRNVLVLITLVYISGGLHLDGFMDMMDGIFSGRKPSRILEIMHDSQVGSFGVIGFVLLMLLKLNLLASFSGINRIVVLLIMPVVSRFMMVFSIKYFPLAESSKLGSDFKSNLRWREVIGSTIWLVLLFLFLNQYYFLSYFHFLIIFLLSLGITILFGYYIKSKIKGITGDIIGAINEIMEVLVLLISLIYIQLI